jgi:uncharacterized protein
MQLVRKAIAIAIAIAPLAAAQPVPAPAAPDAAEAAAQAALAKRFAEMDAWVAKNVDVEDMVRITMRDGVHLNGRIYFPKNTPRTKLPTVLWFFPYEIQRPHTEDKLLLQNGYAVAYVNSRGRYFSEGVYTYMGGSGNDGYDTIDFLSKQPWSNGKVGTLGCSSSAEEQHKMNAAQPPALAAAEPRSSGAGIGRIGPYVEEGNLYRGGILVDLWFEWYHTEGWKYSPHYPSNLTRDQLLAIRGTTDLEPNHIPKVNFDDLIWTLPLSDIPKKAHSAPNDFTEFLTWGPGDPRWKTIDFGNEGNRNGSPTLYVNAWYDMSTGPNLAMFEYQSQHAANQKARDNTFMIVAPTGHCEMGRMESEHTIVGERDMGDARFDYDGFMLRWFDHWLKGIDNGVEREPKVRVYNMGAKEWRTFGTWPPKEARPVTYYLDSNGKANTRGGDGKLTIAKPGNAAQDRWTYDPLKPTPSVGGQVCCFAAAKAGSFDQSEVEERPDVMVYTSDPLQADLDVTGKVVVTLNLSSDVKDTDLIATLVDVGPDGKAYNLDTQGLRVRYRKGYERQVFMEKGQVYEVTLPPLVTSNTFKAGHRLRIAIQSSYFPVLSRNLNTGGSNYDEKDPVTAHNTIHHGGAHLSSIVLDVLPAR